MSEPSWRLSASRSRGGTPQAYAALIKSDLAKWGKVVKEAGIQPE